MKPRLDPQASTLELNYRPTPSEVKMRLIVGLAVTAIASLIGYFLRDDGVALFVLGGFGFFGLLNILYGTLQSRFSLSMVISRLEVAVDRRSLWGRTSWRESLRSYRGVQLRQEELEESNTASIHFSTRFSIIELLHPDPSKTVPLYVQEGGVAPREIQHAFATRFHLPELAHDISGAVSPGSLMRAPDPGPPPPGVVVHESGGVTCFAIGHSRRWRWVPWLFWLALPLGFGWLVYQIEPSMAPLAAGMAAALVVLLLLIDMLFRRGKGGLPRGLCVSSDAIWLGRSGDPPSMPVPFHAIQAVRLDRARGRAHDGGGGQVKLVVDGGSQRIEFSGGLFDRRKVEWIRNRVLYLVSRARR
jgi:hypothetical protein